MAWYPLSTNNQHPPVKPPLGAQLNRSHPLAQGLVGCWLFNEGGGSRAINAVTGSLANSVNGARLLPDRAEFVQASSQAFQDRSVPIISDNKFSVFCVAKVKTQTAASATLLGTYHDAPSTNKGFALKAEQYNNTGKMGITFGNVFDYEFSALITPSNNTLFSFGVAVSGTTAIGVLDGNKIQTITVGALTPSTQSGFLIGGWRAKSAAAVSDPLDGSVYVAFLYNRALSASEIASLHANPYQMFMQPPMWVNLGASGGTTSVSADLAFKWDGRALATVDLTLKFDTLAQILSDSSLKWDLRSLVNSDLALVWDIRQWVGSNLTSVWDLASALASVSSDSRLVWDLRQVSQADLTLEYDLLQTAAGSLALKFDLFQQTASDLALKYDIYQTATSDLAIIFDTRNYTSSDLRLIYDMAGTVFNDCTLKWDLGETGGRILIIGSSFKRIIG